MFRFIMKTLTIALVISVSPLYAQKTDSLHFPVLPFNPYENFHHVAFDIITTRNGQDRFDFGSYTHLVPFGMGIEKDIYRSSVYLLSASASINVQFLFRNEESQILNGIRKTHFNSDFFLRIHNTFRLSDKDKIRATLYHRSTHLGDDYILLNNVGQRAYWTEDDSNYEALQLQYAREENKFVFYAGTQLILRPDTPRSRFEFHQGITLQNFGRDAFVSRLFIGYDLRFLSNNDYNADLDVGFGYQMKWSSIRINYFRGHIPFSRYERTITSSWIGLGIYVNASHI